MAVMMAKGEQHSVGSGPGARTARLARLGRHVKVPRTPRGQVGESPVGIGTHAA